MIENDNYNITSKDDCKSILEKIYDTTRDVSVKTYIARKLQLYSDDNIVSKAKAGIYGPELQDILALAESVLSNIQRDKYYCGKCAEIVIAQMFIEEYNKCATDIASIVFDNKDGEHERKNTIHTLS